MTSTSCVTMVLTLGLLTSCGYGEQTPTERAQQEAKDTHLAERTWIRPRTARDDEPYSSQPAVWRVEDADGICYGIPGSQEHISCIPKPSSCAPEPRGAPKH